MQVESNRYSGYTTEELAALIMAIVYLEGTIEHKTTVIKKIIEDIEGLGFTQHPFC